MRRLLFVLLMISSPAYAKTVYVDNSLSADCAGSTYSTEARNCAGADGTAYNDFVSAIATLVPGDTLYIRAGTYTERMNFQDAGITGSAGAYLTIAGYPGETVRFQTTSASVGSYGPIKVRGAGFGWFIFRNLILDGSLETDNTIWQIRDGNHDFILEDIILENFASSSLLLKNVSNITIRRCTNRNTRNISASSFYGLYFSVGTNVLVEDSELYNNGGGGIHVYPGPITGLTIRRNKIHDNNSRTGSNLPVGGIVVYETALGAASGDGGPISGVKIYDNVIYNNGTIGGVGNGGSGVFLTGQTDADGPDGTEIYNNTIYGQNGGTTGWSQGIRVGTSGSTNTIIKNNVTTNNQHGQISDNGTGTTIANNACLSGDSCGTTGKVSLASNAVCFISTTDFRLVAGTNPCVNAGATVSTRPTPVSTPDIGAYERGAVSSAAVVGSTIEVTTDIMTPGLLPSSGITGFTIACVGCTGTPVVSAATVKAVANNIVVLTIAGISSTGSCTVSKTAGSNLTDSGPIGGSTQTAQTVNSVSALSVTGTCANTAATGGSVPPDTHYKMNEGSGATLLDATGNGHTGSLSGSPTYTTPVVESYGLRFDADGVDRRALSVTGSGIDPTATSFTVCSWVKADAGLSNKIIFGTPNGTNQRLYVGVPSGGVTWVLGVGASSYSTGGASEFPVTTTLTHICLINNAATDTVTLAINGAKGISAAAVKSTVGLPSLAGNFQIGCGVAGTFYCGGYTVDEFKIWSVALSTAEVLAEYQSYSATGTGSPCYQQKTHRFQDVYLDESLSPTTIGSNGDAGSVIAGGAIALVAQFDCTGSLGAAINVRPYYSLDGTNYTQAIPDALGADGIAMWGNSIDPTLNRFSVTCCLTGALTATTGQTVLTSIVTPQVPAVLNASVTHRIIIRISRVLAGSTFYIKFKQDNGSDLAGGYTPSTGAQLNVIAAQANAGY